MVFVTAIYAQTRHINQLYYADESIESERDWDTQGCQLGLNNTPIIINFVKGKMQNAISLSMIKMLILKRLVSITHNEW